MLLLHVSVNSSGYATPLRDAHILILLVVVIVTVIFLRDIRTIKLLALVKVDFAQGTEVHDKRLVELRLWGMNDSGPRRIPVKMSLTFMIRRLPSVPLSCRLRLSLYYMTVIRAPITTSRIRYYLPLLIHKKG